MQILLEYVEENINIASAAYIGLVESKVIENLLQHNNADDDGITSQFNTVPSDDNHVASVLTEVNPKLDDNTLYNLINAKCALVKLKMDVGSITSSDGECIVDDNNVSRDSSNNSDYSYNDDEGFIIIKFFKKSINKVFYLDSAMVSTIHRGRGHGVNASKFSSIWSTNKDIAKRTLEFTIQWSIRMDNSKLLHNYGTSDDA